MIDGKTKEEWIRMGADKEMRRREMRNQEGLGRTNIGIPSPTTYAVLLYAEHLEEKLAEMTREKVGK